MIGLSRYSSYLKLLSLRTRGASFLDAGKGKANGIIAVETYVMAELYYGPARALLALTRFKFIHTTTAPLLYEGLHLEDRLCILR